MIQILVDSASDYTKKEINEKGLLFVPLQITIEGQTYLDGVDIEKEEFYSRMISTKEFFKTSQPNPQNYVSVFEEIKENGDELICLCLSSALSGTYQSALLAKNLVEYENVHVIDTLSATCGIRLLCEVALKWIEEGKETKEIVSDLENLKSRIRIFAGVDTLEYLAKGGRITKTAATIGNLVSLKPIISVEEGKVEVIGKTRGVNKAVHYITDKMDENPTDESYPMYSIYSYGQENTEKLEKKMTIQTQRVQLGSTIGVHIGPGAFGVCYICK